MEQLIYFLEHTESTSSQIIGVLNFIFVFIIVPLLLAALVIYLFIKIWKVNNRNAKTNLKKEEDS